MSSDNVDDLSRIHRPISGLLSASALNPTHPLNNEQLRFFHEHGYLKGIPLLDDAQLQALRLELGPWLRPGHRGQELWHEYHANESLDPASKLFHALGAWRLGVAFHDLLWNPAFVNASSQLLEGPVRFWHDQLFCKPARHGGVVAWHQDYSYWQRTAPIAHLTCWIALHDSTVENGCLHYIPGSHQWDLLPITGLTGEMDAIAQELSPDQIERYQNPIPIELKAGECSFHHPLTIHGSFANLSAHPRWATVINVVKDGVTSLSDRPLLEGTPIIQPGEALGGRFHPKLSC